MKIDTPRYKGTCEHCATKVSEVVSHEVNEAFEFLKIECPQCDDKYITLFPDEKMSFMETVMILLGILLVIFLIIIFFSQFILN